jgi:hypothetical protein
VLYLGKSIEELQPHLMSMHVTWVRTLILDMVIVIVTDKDIVPDMILHTILLPT